TLSTDSAVWVLLVPGILKYPHLNITLGFQPIFTWPEFELEAGSDLVVGPLSLQLTITITNGTTIILPQAVVLNITVEMTLSTKISLSGNNQLALDFNITQHSD